MQKSANFSSKYRVYYEDTDSGGVVYYANYLKFFERCRTDFLRSHSINQKELAQKEGLLFVVRKCNIEYLLPAKLDDMVEVSLSIKEVRAASILLHQKIILNGVILAHCAVEIVSVSTGDFKPKKISNEIRNIFTS